VQGTEPRPYKKTDDTPHLGIQDSTDDMRGGLGYEGLQELYKFVQQGGVLITEGGTSTIFPEFNLSPGVSIEDGDGLYVRGSVLKAMLGDKSSPVLYGYDQNTMAVYFNQAPILSVGPGGAGRGGRGGPGVDGGPGSYNMQPNSVQPRLTTLDGPPPAQPASGRGGRGGGGGGGGGGGSAARRRWRQPNAPRVLLSFPTDRTTCSSRACSSAAKRFAAAPSPSTRRRQGTRGDVRQPPVLALADAGELLPRLQHDPELERSRRGRRAAPARAHERCMPMRSRADVDIDC
jgi:hypothetical protein